MYAGDLVGIFIVMVIGDMIGRKTLMMAAGVTMFVGVLATAFSANLWMGGVSMFVCLLGESIATSLCTTIIY